MGVSSKNPKILLAIPFVLFIAMLLIPEFAFADVQTSLDGIKDKLTGVILPTLSVIGMCFAAFSFFTGNPQAKQHIVYAILGCCFGFGAESIMHLIRDTVK